MAQPKKPAGAPAQGAGGQKAAGQAAPPSKPAAKPPPPPKPPPKPKAAAGAPAQGAGGQKAGQPAAPAAPAAPKAKPLTPQQTKQLAKAQAGGTEAQYLANHPGVAKHQQKIGAPTPGAPGQGAGGAKNAAGANATTPPPGGAPGQGAGGNKGGAQPPPGTDASAGAPAGAPAPAAPTVEDILNKQYGSNAASTFQQDWYGDNPLTTAMNAANRVMGQNLADVRARYAGSGFGNSAREALAEGQAIGDVSTNLGANLAQLGTNVRSEDLNRLANMFSTAGEQDIQQKQIGAELNKQLADLGTGVTGIGASEQAIPGAELITTLLTNMSRQPTYSQGAQKLPRK